MNEITPLCEIAFKYGTDKCPQINHVYTPFYYELFKDRRDSVKAVLEMGIGTWRRNYLPDQYITGASLRMWRDFFPNAQIYGADINPACMFEDERIRTFTCDSTKPEEIEQLMEQTGPDIDLFVDDGQHRPAPQIILCLTAMPLLKRDVVYVIEDVGHTRELLEALKGKYNCYMPELPGRRLGRYANKLMVVQNA